MIKITCTSCQKPLSLDETKLPMKEVSFPCPACKATLTFDRRTFEGTSPAVDMVPAVVPVTHPHQEEDHDGFGARALLVGTDHPGIRQAAKLIGYIPVHVASALEPVRAVELSWVPASSMSPTTLKP